MDLREYDREAFRRQVLQHRKEYHTTIYCCLFLPLQLQGQKLLAAGYSTGSVRVFSVLQIVGRTSTKHTNSTPLLSFQAHSGAVNCFASYASGDDSVLISGGDDGMLKVWRIKGIVAACNSSDTPSGPQYPPEHVTPIWQVQIPCTTSPLGPVPRNAAVMAIAVDQQHQAVYVGAGDGGCHVVNLRAVAGPQAVESLPGHVAAVHGVDYSETTHQLASASEDSTVRLWDVRSRKCSRLVNAWEGVDINDTPASLLKHVEGPPITAVRFDPCGSWLICSCGDLGLSCMSLLGTAGVLEQPNTSCTPQFLSVQPGEILSVGTESFLTRYDFSFKQRMKCPISSKSAFWIDVDKDDGSIAVCGSHGALDIVSHYGTRLGSLGAVVLEE